MEFFLVLDSVLIRLKALSYFILTHVIDLGNLFLIAGIAMPESVLSNKIITSYL